MIGVLVLVLVFIGGVIETYGRVITSIIDKKAPAENLRPWGEIRQFRIINDALVKNWVGYLEAWRVGEGYITFGSFQRLPYKNDT